MDPIHLNEDELEYELTLRNIYNLSNRRTKTSALRDILLKERMRVEVEPRESSHLHIFIGC